MDRQTDQQIMLLCVARAAMWPNNNNNSKPGYSSQQSYSTLRPKMGDCSWIICSPGIYPASQVNSVFYLQLHGKHTIANTQ